MGRQIFTLIFLIWAVSPSISEDGKCKLLPGPRGDERSIGYSCVEVTFDHVKDVSNDANWIEFSVSKLRIPEKAFARFSLHTLSFHKCDMEYIHPDAFKGIRELQWLTFWKSNIHVLQASWFIGLTNLNHLLLENTGIVYIEPKTFLEIPNLKYLNIEDNNLNCLAGHALAPLRKLKHLRIRKNPWLCHCYEELVKWILNRQIDFGTGSASVMKYECMSEWDETKDTKSHVIFRNSSMPESAPLMMRGSCTGKTLPILSPIPDDVKSIKLSGVKISTVPEFAFFQFGNSLRTIDLSGCSISEIHSEAFAGLPKLEQLILSNSSITTIKAEWFRDLRGLKGLQLDHNRIKHIEQNVFPLLDKLETLNLEQNEMDCLSSNTFGLMKNLRRVNIGKVHWDCGCLNDFRGWLDRTQIAYSLSGGQCNYGNSQTIEGQNVTRYWNNSFERNFTFESTQFNSKNYSEIHGTSTQFHYDFPKEFESYYPPGRIFVGNGTERRRYNKRSSYTKHVTTNAEPQLRRRGCSANDPHHLQTIRACPSACTRIYLQAFPMSYRYHCFGGTLSDLNAIPDIVESITFEHTAIDIIPNYAFFRFGGNLRILEFSDCMIQTIESQAFSGLVNLDELIIHGNNIHEVRHEWFECTRGLRRLVLTDNHISRLQNSVFQYLPNLQHLVLTDNQLNCIGIESLNYLPKLTIMDVHKNPWTCLCRRKLVQWLDERRVTYNTDVSEGFLDWNCPNENPHRGTPEPTWPSIPPRTTMKPTTIRPTTTEAPIVPSPPPPPQNLTIPHPNGWCKLDPPKSSHCVCSGGNIFVLDEIPDYVERIEIRNSSISELRADSFARFKNLKELLFYDCGIGKIDDLAFRGLHKLQLLVFQGSGITTIKSAWFRDLAALTTLDFSKNHVNDIDADVFTHIHNLRVLNLEDNEIGCIYTYSLSAARNLKEISLQNNPWKWRCIEELTQFLNERKIRYTDFRMYQGKRITCELNSEAHAEESKGSGTTNTSISTVNVLCVSVAMVIFTKF